MSISHLFHGEDENMMGYLPKLIGDGSIGSEVAHFLMILIKRIFIRLAHWNGGNTYVFVASLDLLKNRMTGERYADLVCLALPLEYLHALVYIDQWF